MFNRRWKSLRIDMAVFVMAIVAGHTCRAAEPKDSPEIEITHSNHQLRVSLPLLPHVASFAVEASTNLMTGFTTKTSGRVSGRSFIDAPSNVAEFFRVQVSTISSNDLLSAIVLNRLAYGPTPDEIERIKMISPQSYIDEQLAPEKIKERPELELYDTVRDGWEYVTQTGRATSSELWLLLWDGGPAFIDDLALVRGTVPGQGENLIRNGNF